MNRPNLAVKNAILLMPVTWLGSFFSDSPAPKITIDIKFKHLEHLKAKRTQALQQMVLLQSEDGYVPATIRTSNESVKVRLRLKGDLTDHLEGNKWAFRIHVKGNNHIFGMRRFSLHHPQGRDYQGEPVFFDMLREEGILAPRYFFVDVVLNGDSLGLMAFEEHFSNELLEAQGRKDSVILHFDESLVWKAEDGWRRGLYGTYDNFSNSQIISYRENRIAKSQRLSEELRIATGLLRGFVTGSLLPSQVFDAELYGRFIAIADIWGSWHTHSWTNVRFYYNPLTGHIEPIAFDADTGNQMATPQLVASRFYSGNKSGQFVNVLLQDPKILASYIKTLERLKPELENGTLTKKIHDAQMKFIWQLWRDYPLAGLIDTGLFQDRTQQLLQAYHRTKDRSFPESHYPKHLHVYSTKGPSGPQLEIANAIPFPLEVVAINWVAPSPSPGLSFQPSSPFSLPIDMPGTPILRKPKRYEIPYSPLSESEQDKYRLVVTYRFKGNSRLYQITASPYFATLVQPPLIENDIQELLVRHSFLKYDKDHKHLQIEPGIWRVSKTLALPQGLGLRVPAGVTLQFSEEAALIIQGPLVLEGTPEAPIVLEGQSQKNTWQGIAVLHAGPPSVLSNVIVRNTTGINQNGWKLTGGVTFYKSDVRMEFCQFIGNQTEDALNIVHSTFTLRNVDITDAISDGFDADFSKGTVEGGTFRNIGVVGGGDAIDISGSEVSLAGTHFVLIYDKALSVGEGSHMSADNLTIEEINVGAASKDGSTLHITNSQIDKARHAALMAYTKKSEYGPTRIQADNVHINPNTVAARTQKGSIIVLNGSTMATEDIDVKTMYKTTMKPGLQR